MIKLTEWLTQHAIAINVASTILLIANALLIIINTMEHLHDIRYIFSMQFTLYIG